MKNQMYISLCDTTVFSPLTLFGLRKSYKQGGKVPDVH